MTKTGRENDTSFVYYSVKDLDDISFFGPEVKRLIPIADIEGGMLGLSVGNTNPDELKPMGAVEVVL